MYIIMILMNNIRQMETYIFMHVDIIIDELWWNILFFVYKKRDIQHLNGVTISNSTRKWNYYWKQLLFFIRFHQSECQSQTRFGFMINDEINKLLNSLEIQKYWIKCLFVIGNCQFSLSFQFCNFYFLIWIHWMQ